MFNNFFKDKENLIYWDIIPSFNDISNANNKHHKRLKSYLKKLNSWQDDDIAQFITRKELGKHIEDILNEKFRNNTACFAFDTRYRLVGVVILQEFDNKTANLDYIVLNEKYRNQGLGTRIIKSVKDNLTKILQSPQYIDTIYTMISDENPKSQKAFIKNGFYVKPGNNKMSKYSIFMCDLREKEQTSLNL